MRNKVIVKLLFVLGLWGCSSDRVTSRWLTSRAVKDIHATIIYRDKKSKSSYLQIEKVINSSCYCADVIAEMYVDRKIVYRLYYGCSIYKTRKELFSYCSLGSLGGVRRFDGTDEKGSTYETRLDATDKFVLHKIDSFIQTEHEGPDGFKLCRKTIEGFKKVKIGA